MDEPIPFKIHRHRPQIETHPRFETLMVNMDPNRSVLDALEKIRLEQDATLMYRHSCHHSSCGTCGMVINNQERLACVTPINQLKTRPITLEPLPGFPLLGDLAVDMASFYQDMDDGWDYLRAAETQASIHLPDTIKRFEQFENCIECGCCVSACPESGPDKPFMGPAVLAGVDIELKKSRGNEQALINMAASKRGERLCKRTLACSRVCPTHVNPARHIQDLRRRLQRPPFS
jgi:succinate dehydrogenase / fumarate reductase iron-sulfur subunit